MTNIECAICGGTEGIHHYHIDGDGNFLEYDADLCTVDAIREGFCPGCQQYVMEDDAEQMSLDHYGYCHACAYARKDEFEFEFLDEDEVDDYSDIPF